MEEADEGLARNELSPKQPNTLFFIGSGSRTRKVPYIILTNLGQAAEDSCRPCRPRTPLDGSVALAWAAATTSGPLCQLFALLKRPSARKVLQGPQEFTKTVVPCSY